MIDELDINTLSTIEPCVMEHIFHLYCQHGINDLGDETIPRNYDDEIPLEN